MFVSFMLCVDPLLQSCYQFKQTIDCVPTRLYGELVIIVIVIILLRQRTRRLISYLYVATTIMECPPLWNLFISQYGDDASQHTQ